MKITKDQFYETLFTCLKWLALLIAVHIIALVLYSMALEDMTFQLANDFPDEPNKPKIPLLIFDLVFIPLFFTLYGRILSPISSEERSIIKKSMREGSFSLLSHWKAQHLKNTVCATSMFALIQVPFVIFFANFGFSFTVSIILDRFYFLDAGFYAITNSALPGWLLCTLFFAACFVATRLIPILLTSREE